MTILSEKEKTVHVGIEDDPKETVKYDQEGWTLKFDFELPNKMVKLSKAQVKNLHKANKDAYMTLVKMLAEEEADEQTDEEDKVVSKLALEAYGGTAKAKLNYETDTDKWQYWWARPDNVENLRETGFTVVKGEETKTLRNKGQKGKTHTVGPGGDPELVLMKRPREVQAEHTRKRQERARFVREGAQHQLEREGFKDPKIDEMDRRRRSQIQLGPISKDSEEG